MATKLHIKKGDQVIVITGEDKGKEGKVLSIDSAERAVVEGLNMVSRHTKPNAKNPQGAIVKKEASIHVSNLKLIDGTGKATRVGRRINKEGKSERYSKKSGEVIK